PRRDPPPFPPRRSSDLLLSSPNTGGDGSFLQECCKALCGPPLPCSSFAGRHHRWGAVRAPFSCDGALLGRARFVVCNDAWAEAADRKRTRLNSSRVQIS